MCDFVRNSQTVSKAAELVYIPSPGNVHSNPWSSSWLLVSPVSRSKGTVVVSSLSVNDVEHLLMGVCAFYFLW